uniref:DYW domain-containing protein n=1 Tax=Ananas comosus var. bracteatus TaxID=296719 RepID=A0A6V7PMS8_ANACO|nr:unnamed protein product [Ananas comosus var. bracteatus]
MVHQFIVGDTSHSRIKDILAKWEEIEGRIRIEGYVPDKKEVLLDIEEEEKEDVLSRHSEKLAIAFALISTGDSMGIRVVKNLRVCRDCHHVTKLISKVYCREIIVRDRTRFHLFKNGPEPSSGVKLNPGPTVYVPGKFRVKIEECLHILKLNDQMAKDGAVSTVILPLAAAGGHSVRSSFVMDDSDDLQHQS